MPIPTPEPPVNAINPRGEIDPRFCVTCGQLLDYGAQDWFWHGDHSSPEHWACRRLRLGLHPPAEAHDDHSL
jgi:hypothetical protein